MSQGLTYVGTEKYLKKPHGPPNRPLDTEHLKHLRLFNLEPISERFQPASE